MGTRSIALVGVTLTVLTACGGQANTAPAVAPQPGGAAPATKDVDVCALMPLGDVQGHSPFTNPMATAKRSGDVPGVCAYAAAPGADPSKSGGILLSITAFSSKAEAMTSYRNHRQGEIDRSFTPADVGGLGDTAFAAGRDEVGVEAVLGNRVLDANLGGQYPDVSDGTKVADATALVKLMISRLR